MEDSIQRIKIEQRKQRVKQYRHEKEEKNKIYQQEENIQQNIEDKPVKNQITSSQNYQIVGFEGDTHILIAQEGKEDELPRRISINENVETVFGLKEATVQVQEARKSIKEKAPTWFKWFIIFYAALNNAVIPPWISSIPAEKYLRITWRFMMQGTFLIPFIMYEKRNGNEDMKKKYSLSYILNKDNLKTIYIQSFSQSLWFTLCLFGFEWTNQSNSIVLSSLTIFFGSFTRMIENKQGDKGNHGIENPGMVLVIIGILFIFGDSITFNAAELPKYYWDYKMWKYLEKTNYQRLVFGNFVPLACSYITCLFAPTIGQVRSLYPPFLTQFIVSFFNVFNMTLSSYFFSGTDIFADTRWGWTGLFTSEQFPTFLFMSIILGLGSFISLAITSKIYDGSSVIVTQASPIIEPVISTAVAQIVGVQHMPSIYILFQLLLIHSFIDGMACLGSAFIVPGQFIIVLGQYLLKETNNNQISLK